MDITSVNWFQKVYTGLILLFFMDLFDLVVEKMGSDDNLRVLTNLKTSKKFSEEAHAQALAIHNVLNEIKIVFSKTNSPWKRKLAEHTKLSVKETTIKDWFLARASISFSELNKISKLGNTEQAEVISKNCNYFCTKTSSSAKFPRELSPDLAWLVAAILCDGHLCPNGSGLAFEVGDLALANVFSSKINIVFESKCMKIREINRIGRNTTYMFDLSNKPVCHFFNKIFEIPFGKKCAIIGVSGLIKNSTPEIKKAFLKGVFDTDGGKRGGGLGLTSLSERFVDDVSELLKEFGINPHKESWLNKKYQKKCFGSRFKIDANSMFLIRRQNEIVPKNNAGVG